MFSVKVNGTPDDRRMVRGVDIQTEGSIRPGFLLIDVRTPADFREVYVPCSMNVPLSDLEGCLTELKGKAAGKKLWSSAAHKISTDGCYPPCQGGD